MTREFVTLPREVVEQALEALRLALSDVDWLSKDSPTQPMIHNAYNATCAALEQPKNHIEQHLGMVPAGWKLVPVEPTQEMLDQLRFGWSDISTAQIIDRWKRTVDAAPQPPTVKECLTVEQPQANQPAMTPIAQRKLDSILAEGYTISGYSVYHERRHQHGFVTGAGLVGWWKPEGVEYPQPLGEQEPVARVVGTGHLGGHFGWCKPDSQDYLPPGALLYTHPHPRREPLTHYEIHELFRRSWDDRQDGDEIKAFARAIEAAHNIK